MTMCLQLNMSHKPAHLPTMKKTPMPLASTIEHKDPKKVRPRAICRIAGLGGGFQDIACPRCTIIIQDFNDSKIFSFQDVP